MKYLFEVFLLIGCLALIARPITVFIHEIGHAIPAVLLTGQKATIYIGSFGDPQKSFRFALGKIEIYFRYNLFAWKLGLCVMSAENVSVNRQLICTLSGPVTSFIVALVTAWLAFTFDLHGFLKLFLVILLGSSIFDLFINLIPRSTPILLYDGSTTYNDGYQIRQLLKYRHLSKQYAEAASLFHAKRYREAGEAYEKLILQAPHDDQILRVLVHSYIQLNDCANVKAVSEKLIELGKMNGDDWGILAVAWSRDGEYHKALELFDTAIQLSPESKYVLINKGFVLTLLHRFEEAIPLFEEAIRLDKDFPYAYNNLGLCKIKLGNTEEGLKDINHSIELEKDNSYAYRDLGIYHFDKEEYSEALHHFTKAKELDPFTHGIDELIDATKAKL